MAVPNQCLINSTHKNTCSQIVKKIYASGPSAAQPYSVNIDMALKAKPLGLFSLTLALLMAKDVCLCVLCASKFMCNVIHNAAKNIFL